MISEDQLEQLAIQWFQDTGRAYANGADLAPEGATPERADFRAIVLKARLAAAVQKLNLKLPPEDRELPSIHGVREVLRVTLIASATEERARAKEERAT